MPFSPNDQLGPYTLISLIGAGGMGEVWKACDTRFNRLVAIKTSKKQFDERFDQESHAIAALNHPNICSLYDVGPDYLVMEHVENLVRITPKTLVMNDLRRCAKPFVNTVGKS